MVSICGQGYRMYVDISCSLIRASSFSNLGPRSARAIGSGKSNEMLMTENRY